MTPKFNFYITRRININTAIVNIHFYVFRGNFNFVFILFNT